MVKLYTRLIKHMRVENGQAGYGGTGKKEILTWCKQNCPCFWLKHHATKA